MNQYGIPTIVLPGINPAEITERFNRGEYVNMKIPKLDNQIATSGSMSIKTNYGGSIHDPSFIVHGKSGIETIYHTTNSEAYSKEHGLPVNTVDDNLQEELECMWCGAKVGSDYLRMPTHTEYTISLNNEFIIEVYGEGCYCGGRCCLADILEKGRGINKHDINYQNSAVVLRMIHFLKYPDEPTLEPAPPRSFLRKHGGPLTREQFLSKVYTYTNTPNIHFLNSKTIIKQENCLNGVSYNGSILPTNKILSVNRPIVNRSRAMLPTMINAPASQVPTSQVPTSQVPNIPGLSVPGPGPHPGSQMYNQMPGNIPGNMQQHHPQMQQGPPGTVRDVKRGNKSILDFM